MADTGADHDPFASLTRFSADNVKIGHPNSYDGPAPVDAPGPAHASGRWTGHGGGALCVILGDTPEHPVFCFALTPAGVRCQDCLEWMHA